LEKHADALTIPLEALVTEKASSFVFVSQEKQARKKPVKVGFRDGSRIEILSGLGEGDSVILAGKTPLADGAAIQAREVK
jgi:membrane fusion protein (multidrug efflux system)